MTDETRDRFGQDPQKGVKPGATPAGVNRIDMAEDGPAMAQTPAGNAAIERTDPDEAFGDPAEVVTPDGGSAPVPGEEG